MAASGTTSISAAPFLDKLNRASPFPISAIQANSCSGFMAAFEEVCRRKGITLAALPPKSHR